MLPTRPGFLAYDTSADCPRFFPGFDLPRSAVINLSDIQPMNKQKSLLPAISGQLIVTCFLLMQRSSSKARQSECSFHISSESSSVS